MTESLRLTGLDPQDPLAFLASLGCLLGASAHCRRVGLSPPTLAFDLGVLLPVLCGPFEHEDALLDALSEDLDEIAGRGASTGRDPFLTFCYDDPKGKAVRDLKPPPEVFRSFAHGLLEDRGVAARRALDWASATLTDVAVDRSKGGAKPFALHFTAGQQRFLTVALELLDGADGKSANRPVDRQDLGAAVFGPWPNDRGLKVFSWSPTQDRAYALRAVDPSGDQKLGTPGADWLALRGVGMLSSAPVGANIQTGGVEGGWKDGTFSYPIWPGPLDADAVRALLRHPALCAAGGRPRKAAARTLPRGVEVLTCQISRSEQGGYGAFSRPSRR